MNMRIFLFWMVACICTTAKAENIVHLFDDIQSDVDVQLLEFEIHERNLFYLARQAGLKNRSFRIMKYDFLKQDNMKLAELNGGEEVLGFKVIGEDVVAVMRSSNHLNLYVVPKTSYGVVEKHNLVIGDDFIVLKSIVSDLGIYTVLSLRGQLWLARHDLSGKKAWNINLGRLKNIISVESIFDVEHGVILSGSKFKGVTTTGYIMGVSEDGLITNILIQPKEVSLVQKLTGNKLIILNIEESQQNYSFSFSDWKLSSIVEAGLNMKLLRPFELQAHSLCEGEIVFFHRKLSKAAGSPTLSTEILIKNKNYSNTTPLTNKQVVSNFYGEIFDNRVIVGSTYIYLDRLNVLREGITFELVDINAKCN